MTSAALGRRRLLAYTTLTLGLAAAGLTTATAAESDPFTESSEPPGSYAWVDLGGHLLRDLDAGLVGFTTTPPYSAALTLEFNPGLAIAGGFGEQITSWLGAEVQGGFLLSDLDRAAGAGDATFPLSGELLQVPVFFNLVLQIPNRSPFTPFAGGGLGPWISWLEVDGALPYGESTVRFEGSDAEVAFGYQVFAGLRFALNEGAFVSLTYRLMGAAGPTWELSDPATGSVLGDLDADPLRVQSLTLGFATRF